MGSALSDTFAMAPKSDLGEFLKSRRDRLRPEDVGLPSRGHRRVPGLGREELAMLAGVSVDYYVRLEQGRDLTPSESVLDALARALRLDDTERAHLIALARISSRSSASALFMSRRVRPYTLQISAVEKP